MTTPQLASVRPITPVVPLADKPADPDPGDFYALVMDTLAALDVPEDVRRTATPLIREAHEARMKALDVKRVQAERAAGAYAAMERTNQVLLQDVKRTVGHLIETNARQHAHGEALAKVRHDVRELVAYANSHELQVLDVRKIEQALALDTPPIPVTPVIVAMATDQRYRFGIFDIAGGPGTTCQRTFLGWSLVAEQPLVRTVPEPTFLDVDGTPKTQSQLRHDGYTLVRLA